MTAPASQLDLLRPGPSHPYGRGETAGHARGSASSRDGAAAVNPVLARLQARVLEIIRAARGATIAEIADALDIPMSTASGRVRELTLAGAIRDSGRKRKNPASGVRVVVWVSR